MSVGASLPAGMLLALASGDSAYVPLALAFTPWTWSEHGPFALQFSRPLLYCVLYCAGLGVGAHGLERGLLAPDGLLARRWAVWLACALASFLLWMGLTALAMSFVPAAPFVLQVAVDISFALACASGCFFAVAVCLRFGAIRSRIFDSLAENAFGMYLFHYMFVVWLQYALLLGMAWFAIAKAMIVFAGHAPAPGQWPSPRVSFRSVRNSSGPNGRLLCTCSLTPSGFRRPVHGCTATTSATDRGSLDLPSPIKHDVADLSGSHPETCFRIGSASSRRSSGSSSPSFWSQSKWDCF